jgi:hypothetical protein
MAGGKEICERLGQKSTSYRIQYVLKTLFSAYLTHNRFLPTFCSYKRSCSYLPSTSSNALSSTLHQWTVPSTYLITSRFSYARRLYSTRHPDHPNLPYSVSHILLSTASRVPCKVKSADRYWPLRCNGSTVAAFCSLVRRQVSAVVIHIRDFSYRNSYYNQYYSTVLYYATSRDGFQRIS